MTTQRFGLSCGCHAVFLGSNRRPIDRNSSGVALLRSYRLIWLTTAGRALLIAALPVWESEHAATEALLTGVDPDRLRGNLRMLY
jgi:hypothetical protein